MFARDYLHSKSPQTKSFVSKTKPTPNHQIKHLISGPRLSGRERVKSIDNEVLKTIE